MVSLAKRTTHGSDPWWRDGLRFRCTACGQCCTGEPGHVWVDRTEIERLARAKGLSVKAFRNRYVRRVGRRQSLREHPNGDCMMLADGRCTVYDAKPQRCSTFPFWGPVLDTPEDWAEASERCEGIGQGDQYDADEIQQILDGDAAVLLRKHQRPPRPAGHEPLQPRLPGARRDAGGRAGGSS